MDWKKRIRAAWLAGVSRARPSIVRVLDHDTEAFTQGLAFVGDCLFESTGLENSSSLRKLSCDSREPEIVLPLDGHWGEGIAYRDGEITQLTWKSGLAFVYAYPGLELTRTLPYEGEGWGLARHDPGFVMSDGSEWLSYRDSQFNLIKRVRVTVRGLPLRWLNDLESTGDRVYANRLEDNNLYEIDARTGKVLRIIDCSELYRIAAPSGAEDVLNGIAYMPEQRLFALTGKRWSKLFYVSIPAT